MSELYQTFDARCLSPWLVPPVCILSVLWMASCLHGVWSSRCHADDNRCYKSKLLTINSNRYSVTFAQFMLLVPKCYTTRAWIAVHSFFLDTSAANSVHQTPAHHSEADLPIDAQCSTTTTNNNNNNNNKHICIAQWLLYTSFRRIPRVPTSS